MKKLLLLLLTALAFTFGCLALASCDFTEEATPTEELEYILNVDEESYSVTGIGTVTHTDIVIPSTYKGKPVTAVKNSAFFGINSLTSVTIPDSVISIGNGAFEWCRNLTSVTIPDSVTSIGLFSFLNSTSLTNIMVDENNSAYSSQDGVLFNKNKTELICYPAGKIASSYTIPDGVTSIENYAFYACENLTSINLPDSVTFIGRRAFDNSTYYQNESNWKNDVLYIGKHLIKVETSISGEYNIQDGTLTIATNAFDTCVDLTSITIPDSVISIGKNAFDTCTNLTSIIIPASVMFISSQTFWGCDNLTSITIPNSVTSIGDEVFYSCESLANIEFQGTIEEWNAIEKGNNWNYRAGDYTVICTNGTLSKEGNVIA